MFIKQNLHTHCTFCDGRDTPEEMIAEAAIQGFDSIGFSSHSSSLHRPIHNPDGTKPARYREYIRRLKDEYKGKIDIYLGLESDLFLVGDDLSEYDYVIGSVHYLELDGQILNADVGLDAFKKLINEHFGGDGMAVARNYYEMLSRLPEVGKFDIIGHFDIITKHIEAFPFVDVQSREYRRYAIEAAESLAGKIPYFEVNTGAAARGYRTTFYPDPYILRELKRLGFGAVITTDCHDRTKLGYGFDDARQLLCDCGYREIYVLGDGGFKPVSL